MTLSATAWFASRRDSIICFAASLRVSFSMTLLLFFFFHVRSPCSSSTHGHTVQTIGYYHFSSTYLPAPGVIGAWASLPIALPATSSPQPHSTHPSHPLPPLPLSCSTLSTPSSP